MKRYLNKIILIQSAKVKYLEIELNGNVHFIGDQGVGKSTVLRAILFFYNANTQQLGISASKNDFTDYYFQYPNSHIIYEIATEHHKFCVWLNKENNKLNYRFINAPYQRDFFIIEQNVREHQSLTPDQVLEKIRTTTSVSRKINRFSEYRDIIYGSDKSFQQYALLESKVYQNIPRTIGNIFLNSSLKSEAIKETIINSIDTDDQEVLGGKGYRIDLDVLRAQLADFKQDYDDIADFEKIKNQAKVIIQLHEQIIQTSQRKIWLAQNLGAALKNTDISIEQNNIIIQKNQTILLELEQTLNTLTSKFKTESEELTKKKHYQEQNIENAKTKIAHYQSLKMEEVILPRVAKEEILKNELNSYTDRLKVLTAAFESIEQKYQILFNQLQVELANQENTIRKKINELEKNFHHQKQTTNDRYQNLIEDLNRQYEIVFDETTDKRDAIQNTIHDLERKRDTINTTRYFEKELEEVKALINQVKEFALKNQSEFDLKTQRIEVFQKEWDIENRALENDFGQKNKEFQLQLQELQNKITDLDLKIGANESSLYGFLNENYPGWENNIGRVCDINLLFNSFLNPQLLEQNELLFGVKLDLNGVETEVKTIAEYEFERKKQLEAMEQLKNEFQDTTREHEESLEKIRKKYNDKIKQLKVDIQQHSLNLNKCERDRLQYQQQLGDLQQQILDKRSQELAKINPILQDNQAELARVKYQITLLKTQHKKEVEQNQIERNKEINSLNDKFNQDKSILEGEINLAREQSTNKKRQFEKEKLAELQGKGFDTVEFESISKKIDIIGAELIEIDKLNRDYVYPYEKDKKEYIDRLPEFNNLLDIVTKELEIVTHRFESQKSELEHKQNQIKSETKTLSDETKILQRHKDYYEKNFKSSTLYLELIDYIEHCLGNSIDTDITGIITRIFETDRSLTNNKEEFKAGINRFVSPFRENNIFGFKKPLGEITDYQEFAVNLKEFIEEDKIERIKQDVKRMYADLLKLIVQDINQLTARRKDVDEIVNMINHDFEKHNFVGVVQEVKIKIESSENKVVQTLIAIKAFDDENPLDFGEPNLFTGAKLEENNEKASKLLTTLLKNLGQEKSNTISLADTFELRFKVIENQKDTGWQEKLTDIGSNGTDILVKAMIYIMLLNVFKERASRKFKDFMLHCIMDEVGVIHTKNITSLIKFANDRGIWMINGSPDENNALAYKYVYNFEKNENSITKANRLIAQN